MRRIPFFLVALAGLAAAGACSPRGRPSALGRRIGDGKAQGLRPSPDGSRIAWLDRCARPAAAQAPALCDLVVAPVEGGGPSRVAEGVSSLVSGYAWGRDGSLAALANHDPASGTGALVVLPPGGKPEALAPAVSFYGFGPGGELGLVSAGELQVARPGGRPVAVAAGGGVATFEFDPADPGEMLARRQSAAGGALVRVRAGTAVPLSQAPAGDYAWSPDGRFAAATVRGAGGTWDLELWPIASDRPPVVLARDVQAFSFARDSSAVAFLAGMAPGRPGDLYAATLGTFGASPKAALVAKGVGEFRWATAAPRLAWLEAFDPRIRAGALGVGGPGAPSSSFGKNVTAFDVSPSGDRVAFLEHVTAGGYSVDLVVAAPGGPAATVAHGVFGFDFSPDGRWLYYRSNCVRNAEACDLFRIPSSGIAPGGGPERLAEGVKSFEFDPSRPERILVGYARKDVVALDLAVWDRGRLVPIDQAVAPGTARFLPPDGNRLAYVVVDPERAGVYVARLP
ncbi:MAG TPA: hypothetical protein VMT17_11500 [Anaeromyxobacteraceae bacterium]|nr:hypothetical protein [Anaeromyxobacteraceae bacterium]